MMDMKARPAVEAVAFRSLSLVAVLFRDNLERELAGESRPRGVVERLNTLLMEWLDRENLKSPLTKRERALLDTPLGGWDERAIGDVSWKVEAAGTLLWAAGLVSTIPAYDALFELEEVIPTLHVFEAPAPFLARVALRGEEDIERQREVAEVWHWRARTAELQRRSGLMPSPQNVQAALQRAITAGAFAAGQDGDFPAFGKAYRDLSPDELERCAAIARERHHALEWLCGRAADGEDPT